MEVISFPNASALDAYLDEDAATPSRYPVRFIDVHGLQAWQDIVRLLRSKCVVLPLSSLGEEHDILPYLGDLITRLEAIEADQVVLLPLGELLRMRPENTPAKELATWASGRSRRVYIPVLDASDVLIRDLESVGRYRSGECSLWSLSGEGYVDIYVAPVAIRCTDRPVIQGLSEYLAFWEKGGGASAVVVTELAPFLQSRFGQFGFRVSPDAYSTVRECVKGTDQLAQAWGNTTQWAWLARNALPDESLETCASRLLNVRSFGPELLFANWQQKSEEHRWLAWLWGKVRAATGSLIGLILRNTGTCGELEEEVCHVALRSRLSPDQISERLLLLQQLGVEELPVSCWGDFEIQKDRIMRLSVLPGFSERECEQIVLEVAALIREQIPQSEWLPYLDHSFPELAVYLTAFPYDARVRDYMRAYVISRVTDAPSEQLLGLANQWEQNKSVWDYQTRASALDEAGHGITTIKWVDALGAEWAGVLRALLDTPDIETSLWLGRAEFPTSTFFNRGWPPDAFVERELDKLAHDLSYSYPRSLVKQLKWIRDLARRIRQACQYSDVIITGDHGLTRFATHGAKIQAPDGFTVHKWGRYATAPANTAMPDDSAWIVDRDHIILSGHSLLTGGSTTSREVHGGATLEESLVPVLRVGKRGAGLPKVVSFMREVRLDTRGHGTLRLQLSGPAQELRLSIAGHIFDGRRERGNEWIIDIRGIGSGVLAALLECERGKIGHLEVKVIGGLVEDDMGLP